MQRRTGLGAAAALAFVLGTMVRAGAQAPAVTPGQPYAEVRKILMSPANGYEPVPHSDPDRCGSRTEICARYPETEACAGTGLAPCSMVFRRRAGGPRAIAHVVTSGEELPNLVLRSIDYRAR